MEAIEISLHLWRVYSYAREQNRWLTARDIATGSKVGLSVARHHCYKLADAGIFERVETFPTRYRFAVTAPRANPRYLHRLEASSDQYRSIDGSL